MESREATSVMGGSPPHCATTLARMTTDALTARPSRAGERSATSVQRQEPSPLAEVLALIPVSSRRPVAARTRVSATTVPYRNAGKFKALAETVGWWTETADGASSPRCRGLSRTARCPVAPPDRAHGHGVLRVRGIALGETSHVAAPSGRQRNHGPRTSVPVVGCRRTVLRCSPRTDASGIDRAWLDETRHITVLAMAAVRTGSLSPLIARQAKRRDRGRQRVPARLRDGRGRRGAGTRKTP